MNGIKYIFLGTFLLTGIQVYLDFKISDPARQHINDPELLCTANLPLQVWIEDPSDETDGEIRNPIPIPLPGGKFTTQKTNNSTGPALPKLLDPLTLDRPPPPNQG